MTHPGLNPQQLRAVTSNQPHILVLAGAGTGKTRTLTARVQRLLNDCVLPRDITCITFTKRAAAEMKTRIATQGVFVDTFHAWCLTILREYGHHTGWNGPRLQIIDEVDRKKIRDGIKSNLGFKPTKNATLKIEQAALLINEYRAFCLSHDVIDFDMIQTETLSLLMGHDDISKIPHLLVDEFQDTDPVQYAIIQECGAENIFVVGDDAQSIYRFRGATVENVQYFIDGFSPEVIKLEQNYRSGQNILDYANRIDVKAVKKTLWSEIPHGFVGPNEFATVQDEAGFVIAGITGRSKCLDHQGTSCTDCYGTGYIEEPPLTGTTAILCRTNGYLDEIAGYLTSADIIFHGSRRATWTPQERDYINTLKANVTGNLTWIYGYDSTIKGSLPPITSMPNYGRLHDLNAQYNAINDMLGEPITDQGFLDFIETAGEEETTPGDGVNLLTIHGAKGLEFDNVFIVGCGDGIFPLNSEMSGDALDEATRLFYVAVTRARSMLFISWPQKLWQWGKEIAVPKSRLIPY